MCSVFFSSEVGTFQLVLSYLPNFSAVCVLVTTTTLADHTHQGSSHIDKSTLLSCLFEGDSGRVSPNTVVSYHIRRHGGDIFSAAVRQYGFPYKWVQSLCGISGPTTGGGGEGGEWGEGNVQLQVETSVETMTSVMTALRRRFKAQVNLAQQIVRLGKRRCPSVGLCPGVIYPFQPCYAHLLHCVYLSIYMPSFTRTHEIEFAN